MEPEKLAIFHEHYRDTCSVMQDQRKARDRYFYLVLVVLVIALFDVAAPQGFASAIADVLRSQLSLTTTPDLGYIRSLLWFVLLGLTVRYGQAALAVERQYTYIHQLEAILGSQVEGAFRREGDAYLANYPVFLSWAHYLYTLVFPLLLSVVVLAWTWQMIPGAPWSVGHAWPITVWFNCIVTIAILASVGMYLHAFHRQNRRRVAEPDNEHDPKKGRKERDRRPRQHT